MRRLYNSRQAATLALSFSNGVQYPTAIGATKPLSVLPLMVAISPTKSGEPTIAPILQPVPLLITLEAEKSLRQESSRKSVATSVRV